MKVAIILSDGISQVMMTPENKMEEKALSMITPNVDISVETKSGSFYDSNSPDAARGYTIQECKGGYLRAWEDKDSLMLVLKPKKDKTNEQRMSERRHILEMFITWYNAIPIVAKTKLLSTNDIDKFLNEDK